MNRKVKIGEPLSDVKWIEKGEGVETLVTDFKKPKNDSIMRLSGDRFFNMQINIASNTTYHRLVSLTFPSCRW